MGKSSINISPDIFEDEKMLLIDALPNADELHVMWFKLLCLAGKRSTNGVFTVSDNLAFNAEMLSTVFRRPVETVRRALDVFRQYGMIDTTGGIISIPNWSKYQSEDNTPEKSSKRERQPKEETPRRQSAEARKDVAEEIIAYLNEQANKKFDANTAQTAKLISGRISDGRTVDDFKCVIRKKCAEWMGTQMEQYLRPSTLFAPSHFEEYLNAPEKSAVNNIGRDGKMYGSNGIAVIPPSARNKEDDLPF